MTTSPSFTTRAPPVPVGSIRGCVLAATNLPGAPGRLVLKPGKLGNFTSAIWGGYVRHQQQALDVLEDVQPRHQPGGQSRPADLVDEGLATGGVEPGPVDAPPQFEQLVPGVDDGCVSEVVEI